jgi:uncharacterized membrane protein YobD (UPF0266 family)
MTYEILILGISLILAILAALIYAALSHFLISNLTGKDCLSTFSLGQKLFRYVSHY